MWTRLVAGAAALLLPSISVAQTEPPPPRLTGLAVFFFFFVAGDFAPDFLPPKTLSQLLQNSGVVPVRTIGPLMASCS
jgi:hypothetical protein